VKQSRRTPLGEVDIPLALLLGHGVLLLESQSATDGSGLLVAEVEGEVWDVSWGTWDVVVRLQIPYLVRTLSTAHDLISVNAPPLPEPAPVSSPQ
jgi:hypothetical protein